MTSPAERPDLRGVDAEAVLEVVREVSLELRPRSRGLRALDLDTSLDRDLGFDSLGRVELIGRLERRFRVGLSENLLATAETPRDLLRAVAGAAGAGDRLEAAALPLDRPGAGEAAPQSAGTLLEALAWHVRRQGDRRHILLLPGEGEPEELTYAELDRRARRVAAGLQELGLEPQQTVGLMLPTCLEYFAVFFGIQYAGGIPVPLYPPARPTQIEEHLRRQAGILSTAQVRLLVTFPRVLSLAKLVKSRVETLRRVVAAEELLAAEGKLLPPRVGAQDIAFLQFTSGSTAEPKGVILTHANLLSNLRAIGDGMDFRPDDSVVSWLPLYHDMGLIGAWMGSLYYGLPLHLMSPLSFLTRPSRWLWAIHRHRASLSAAPNFAYELCLNKIDDDEIEGLDLSSLRATLNGAEPVSPETVRRFSERFARYGFSPRAMMPVYGLAECSLALAFPDLSAEPRIDSVRREELAQKGRAEPAAAGDTDALRFVGCGRALTRHEIRIVDGTGAEVGDRREGRLEFRGPSATSGYFRNPEATRRLFRGDWLDSGDRAYLADGELFLTGREKDIIIRAGRNIHPHELEEAVGDLAGIRKGCVAAFGSPDPVSGTERLILLAETREVDEGARDRLRDRIQDLAIDLTGTPADEVVLAPPRTVPKTSSGKIRRAAAREVYETGRTGPRGPVWWQVTRLAVSGARPQAARSLRAAKELLHAGRFWAVVGLAAVPVAVAVTTLPRLARRRRLARQAARQMARLTSTPIRVEGLEHLSEGGPWILAANHASYLDGFALTATLPVEATFLAKRELRSSALARVLLDRLGTLFVERFDPDRGMTDIERALAAVRNGESLLFFPEGTFDRAPGLRAFRLGAFLVACQAGVPVVPVAIRGTRSVLRGREWFPRRGQVAVTVLAPIRPEGDDWSAAVKLRDRVRRQILRHCGEPDLLDEAGGAFAEPA